MNILLTGGAGYIGSNVAIALLDCGYNVTIIDNLSTGNECLIPLKSEFIKCNINESTIIENLLMKEKFGAVMHFAGSIKVEESVINPEKYFDNNTNNSKKFFDVCINNGLSNIIFSSTASIYGNLKQDRLVSEDSEIRPLNPYGESKVKTEEYLLNLNVNKVNYIILRYFNVAGADPKLRSGLISKDPSHLIKIISEVAVGKRDKLTIFGNNYNTFDGTAIRDYIHITDLANLHIKVLEFMIKNKKSAIFNCGYGKGYSVKEVLDAANNICNNKINFQYGAKRAGDAEKLVSDISKLKQMIDWIPKYNKLDFIIKTAIDWELKLQNEKIS